jgi:hypothetical protein
MPKEPIHSSARPNAARTGNRGILDIMPPARLPNPRPSMNALTTIVTDSILTP